jgi:hypothetical protein
MARGSVEVQIYREREFLYGQAWRKMEAGAIHLPP